jgi:hypothetical protein
MTHAPKPMTSTFEAVEQTIDHVEKLTGADPREAVCVLMIAMVSIAKFSLIDRDDLDALYEITWKAVDREAKQAKAS